MNRVKERKSVRKRESEYSEYSEVLCYSHVRLSASTLHSSIPPPETGPAIPPALPSCLLAAVQSNEVVMSLVVMSITLNMTSHGLNQILKKPHSENILMFFSCAGNNMPFFLCANFVYPSTPAKHFHKQLYSLYPISGFLLP